MTSRRSARLAALANSPTKPAAPPAPSAIPLVSSRKRKVATEAPAVDGSDPGSAAPSTPRKRRARAADLGDPPDTPTPAAASLLAEPVQTPSGRRARHAAVARLADPTRTNALLRSPKTSRIIAPEPASDEVAAAAKLNSAPSAAAAAMAAVDGGGGGGVGGAGGITGAVDHITTSATILSEALAHLIRIDPRMKPLIDRHHCRLFSPEGLAEQIDPFEALCSSIISQQVSGAAAKSIKARFIALFNQDDESSGSIDDGHDIINPHPDNNNNKKRFPTPEQVAATPLDRLRTAGLSQRKAEYLVGLAQEFASGRLTAQSLAEAPYEELVERLTAVRGLGRWTVEMFAMFALKRLDVFSTGDLGVQRGMAAFVGRDVAKLKNGGGGGKGGGKWRYMSEKEMVEISERFRPYRSVFMWYMWRVEETDISTLES
ncbi:hypothetical protein VTJ49DRAFT_5920 [Mycothermus thermophilus]|uniref:HhH-GPD domain-containing protein n=1 Tax=Humicola insolens TaxID=85995 RepID=A0ABR3VKL9_HUMIN